MECTSFMLRLLNINNSRKYGSNLRFEENTVFILMYPLFLPNVCVSFHPFLFTCAITLDDPFPYFLIKK